jgi:cardiolipin synthase
VLARYALSRGIELRINWPGRLAVAPVMGALFFAMVGLSVLAEVLLYIGLALALLATAMYVRSGLRSNGRLASGSA